MSGRSVKSKIALSASSLKEAIGAEGMSLSLDGGASAQMARGPMILVSAVAIVTEVVSCGQSKGMKGRGKDVNLSSYGTPGLRRGTAYGRLVESYDSLDVKLP
jgi:hypothetical protein